MNKYLAIITTVLVITQIIRLAQNYIQLRRQKILFKKQVGDLADMEIQKEDFEIQRKAQYVCGFVKGAKAMEDLLERAVEELENCYGRETDLTIEIRNMLNILN